jgi:hypothetical protein
LRQYFIGTLNLKIRHDKTVNFLSDHINNLIAKKERQKLRFTIKVFQTDRIFQERITLAPDYLDGVYILDLRTYDNVEPVNPAKVPKRAGDKNHICYKYYSTPLDLTKNTFRQALEKKNYKRNECWLNTIYDHYCDSLLSPNRSQRYIITREKILNIIGRTEENIQEGLTIDDVLPFFEKYNLRLRVFDLFYKMIFKYEPDHFNNNNKPLYCMTDGDHIYTLNHELPSIQHRQDDNTDEFTVYTTPDFKIDEDKTPIKHHMIESIDDLVKIAKMIKNESEEDEDDNKKKKRNITYIVP